MLGKEASFRHLSSDQILFQPEPHRIISLVVVSTNEPFPKLMLWNWITSSTLVKLTPEWHAFASTINLALTALAALWSGFTIFVKKYCFQKQINWLLIHYSYMYAARERAQIISLIASNLSLMMYSCEGRSSAQLMLLMLRLL